jgi:hypothetical protein
MSVSFTGGTPAGANEVQPSPSFSSPSILQSGMFFVLCIAAANFALHMIFNGRYGYFRDEFDYIACGNHLAWGYVDQPPLIPFLMRIAHALFGDSLRGTRLFAALASSAAIVITGLIARELGGRRYALALSAVAVLIGPVFLSDGSLMTTNALEPLLWMGCAYFAVLAVKREDPRYWLWFGVVAGIGLEEKYSIAVFGFAMMAGLVLTPQRKFLGNRWIWLGGAAAFLIFLPNLLWNQHYDWPFVQLMRNIKASGRDVRLTAWQFFAQQVLLVHPFTAPLWITGLLALLFGKPFRPFRMLGWCYLVAFTVFVVLGGKNYYLSPIYPMLLAAGSVTIAQVLERTRQHWAKPAIVAVLLAAGAWLAPLATPILPVEKFIAYMDRLPIKLPRTERSHFAARLPQHYADQFGWEEMTAAVAQVYHALPPGERAKTAIFGNNYGEAGAIDFLGPKYGLPKSIGGHQNYWLWGPRDYTGEIIIVLGDRRAALEEECASVQQFDFAHSPYALEQGPIFLCRGFKWDLRQAWPMLRRWN